MGNGRELWSGKGSEPRMKGVRVVGAGLLLLLAAAVMLGPASPHYTQNAVAQPSDLPISTALGSFASISKPKSKLDARAILGQLPMVFERNQGQAASPVKFVSRGPGYSLYLDPTGAVLDVQAIQPSAPGHNRVMRRAVGMKLVGANASAVPLGNDPLPGKSNYFIGNDPKNWHTGIPQFAGVLYQSVYPGIDLVFYGKQGRLEYDFKVAPGADPSQAELQFDGATQLELNAGDLILKGGDADIRLQAPHVYQTEAGRDQTVEGHFVLRTANRVGFEIGQNYRGRELVIDPTINYSTFFGGNNTEEYPTIAVNGNGNIYLAGSTTSSTGIVPTGAAPYQGTLAGAENVFVAELNPTEGAAGLLGVTYLGGSGTDTSAGLAVDSSGNAYVTGTTTSTNFPTTSAAYQTAPLAGSTGTSHVFVSVLGPTLSSLNYSTYLSGNGTDVAGNGLQAGVAGDAAGAGALAIDTKGDAFIVGTTTSSNASSTSVVFPASYFPAPFQATPQASVQFFVTEVNTTSTGTASVPYSTYFGGTTGTIAVAGGIAVDTTGNVYFSGTTNFINAGQQSQGSSLNSTDFPIVNAYQPCLDTPPPTQITYPLTCMTPASPVPTDGFVAKLSPANAQTGASQLLYSTYFGGANNDTAPALTIDTGASNVYITGTTNSPTFNIPTGAGEFQPCLNQPGVMATMCSATPDTSHTDAYVAKLSNPVVTTGTTTTTTSTNAVGLSYFSYLGGTGNDSGLAVAVDTGGGALLTGATSSGVIGVNNPLVDFPTTNPGALQSVLNGTQNAFFAHIDTVTTSGTSTVGSYATYFGGSGTDRGTSITVDTNLNTYFAGDTTSPNLQTQGAYQSAINGTMDAFAVELRPANDLCVTCIGPVISPTSATVGVGNPVSITFTVINNGPDLATNVVVTGQVSATTVASFTSASAGAGTICSLPTGTTSTCLIPTLQAGSTATIVLAVTPTVAGGGQVTVSATNANNTSTVTSVTASFTATSYTIHVTPSSQTVTAGSTGVYSVLVQPLPVFENNVSLTCSGTIPAGASCGFTPSTLTFTTSNSAGNQTSVLNLTTTARPVTTLSSNRRRGLIYALWLLAPGAALLGLAGGKRGRNRLLTMLAILTLFAFIVPLPACSKAKEQPTTSGTPAGTYTLSVTATSGSFSQSYGFNLTVQ